MHEMIFALVCMGGRSFNSLKLAVHPFAIAFDIFFLCITTILLLLGWLF